MRRMLRKLANALAKRGNPVGSDNPSIESKPNDRQYTIRILLDFLTDDGTFQRIIREITPDDVNRGPFVLDRMSLEVNDKVIISTPFYTHGRIIHSICNRTGDDTHNVEW